jgi:ADP-ribosyl-[dinitrogen reductase] hydrolase
VHCRGGLGRAGTVAARLLAELGMAPADAISRVRAVRPGAIQTQAQREYVMRTCTVPSPDGIEAGAGIPPAC